MNIPDLSKSLANLQPVVQPATPRINTMFGELHFRFTLIEQDKKEDQEVQIVATIGGCHFYVRRVGMLDNGFFTLETYHDSGYSVTIAPIEQTAFTIHVFKKQQTEQRRFMGFSTAPHTDKRV